jgi:hypothetical protein
LEKLLSGSQSHKQGSQSSEVTLTVEERVFLVLFNDELSYCYAAKVESIQLNGISHNHVEITSEEEVGLKFDRDARIGLTIYVTSSYRVD